MKPLLRVISVILLPLRPASLTVKIHRLKIIRGMRSVGREGRSIDLKMFFVEHPVRVISVAVLVATF